MAEDTKTTDEKTVPKDTMHSGPQAAPDLGPAGLTTNPVTRELAERGIAKPAPEPGVRGEHTVSSVGEFDPEPGSTLVTDIKGSDEQPESVVVNPPPEAPDTVAAQPGESLDDAGERIASQSKEAESRRKETAKSGSK